MNDREYVEFTVAYLAEHVPWMWRDFVVSRKWFSAPMVRPSGHWNLAERWLRTKINPKHHPLVSADWWDERGESKLAELLRKGRMQKGEWEGIHFYVDRRDGGQ